MRYHRRNPGRGLRRKNPRGRVKALETRYDYDRPRHCLTCGVATQKRKDYCSTHVERHPYVAMLIRKIELSDIEEDNVRQQGYAAISPDSIIANDILVILQTQGRKTLERLARDVIRNKDLVERYVEYLYQQGLVNLSENKRGSVVISYQEPETRRRRRNRKRRYYR